MRKVSFLRVPTAVLQKTLYGMSIHLMVFAAQVVGRSLQKRAGSLQDHSKENCSAFSLTIGKLIARIIQLVRKS